MIGLIVTPEGFPLSYEVLAGNTQDSITRSAFLKHIEARYGRANRIWVMDRGVPTEESLEQMRAIGASYLVGTPKGRLTKREQAFLSQPWQRVREGIEVKRLAQGADTYVLAKSAKRINKERAMRRQRLRRYVARLKALQGQTLTRDVIDKFKTIMRVDVHVPTADGRERVLSRYTRPEPEHRVLLDLLRLKLPEKPPPKITAKQIRRSSSYPPRGRYRLRA